MIASDDEISQEETVKITVATWNIKSNSSLTKLAQIISEGAQVICLQEVHNDFIPPGTEKEGSKKYYEWIRIINSSNKFKVIYWENLYTENGTMGTAILYKIFDEDHPFMFKITEQGVHTFEGTIGSASQKRGLPWIKIEGIIGRLYSYHSDSSGDSSSHIDNVNIDLKSMMTMAKEAVFGDFNIEYSKLKEKIEGDEYGISIAHSSETTRPSTSSRIIDYCVYKGANIKFKKVLTDISDSDHYPVLFTVEA